MSTGRLVRRHLGVITTGTYCSDTLTTTKMGWCLLTKCTWSSSIWKPMNRPLKGHWTCKWKWEIRMATSPWTNFCRCMILSIKKGRIPYKTKDIEAMIGLNISKTKKRKSRVNLQSNTTSHSKISWPKRKWKIWLLPTLQQDWTNLISKRAFATDSKTQRLGSN